jgi:hypothetical protein
MTHHSHAQHFLAYIQRAKSLHGSDINEHNLVPLDNVQASGSPILAVWRTVLTDDGATATEIGVGLGLPSGVARYDQRSRRILAPFLSFIFSDPPVRQTDAPLRNSENP